MRILGIVLLIAGLVVIGWALYTSYNIFNGKTVAPEIFKLQAKEIKEPAAKGKISTMQDIEGQLNQMVADQVMGLFPSDTVPKLLNLISYSIFVSILIFGGAQIAGLGAKLIKK